MAIPVKMISQTTTLYYNNKSLLWIHLSESNTALLEYIIVDYGVDMYCSQVQEFKE